MIIRKQNDIEKYIKEVDKSWQLSISEDEFLETVFNFLLGRDVHKANTLLNSLKQGDWEELLKEIPKNAVINFSEVFLDMIEESEVEDCDEKELCDYDDDDLLDECDKRGLKWEDYERVDIVAQSDLEEMTELFLNLTPQKRNEVINSLK